MREISGLALFASQPPRLSDRLNKTAFKQLVRAAVKETVARAKAKEGTKGKA